MGMVGKGFGIINNRNTAGGGSTTAGLVISASDFSGSDYTNVLLSGKIPMTNFNVYALGSGTIKTVNVDYTFAGTTLTMPPDDYLIEIY